jgi:haloacid dehalogenase-like hydrolase
MMRALMGGDAVRPTMRELVIEIKAAGYRTGLLTNIFAERREWLHAIFPEGTIDVFGDSSALGLRKPEQPIYDKLVQLLGCRPEEIAFVDDFPENLAPARAMGIVDIQYESPEQVRRDLIEAGVRIAPPGRGGGVMDLAVLQTVRMKGGTADAATIVVLTGGDEAAVRGELDALVAAEHVQERRGRYRLTPGGRDVLQAALAAERAALDAAALEAIWSDFEEHDEQIKQICHDWQLRDGAPNDHSDAAYDAAVVQRLDALHAVVGPLATRIAGVSPRLDRYPGRLHAALTKVKAGEEKFLANPMVDSYHQVFHELHEELYDATGKDRASEEAAAG